MAQGRTQRIGTVTSKRYWRAADAGEVIEAWKRSGMPLARFAARAGLAAQRISRWAAKLSPQALGSVAFHPVRLTPEAERSLGAAVEIVLVDGRRVRVCAGFAADDLARALAVLEQSRVC